MSGSVQPAYRLAETCDLEGLTELERGIDTAPHWTLSEYAAIVIDGEGTLQRCLYVAVIEEKLAGFAVGKVLDAEAELESVVVDAACRRLGIGQRLCCLVMDWCSAAGADEMILEVRKGSAGAICLYESLGFSTCGVRPKYYRDPPDDAVLMRCQLRG